MINQGKIRVFVVHSDDGHCEVYRDLATAKVDVETTLDQFGFSHELEENIAVLKEMVEGDLLKGYAQWEIDSGGDEPGNLYLEMREI